MLDSLRRSLALRRKVKAAGLRIVCKATMPVDAIRWSREDQPEATFTVRESPHYELLLLYREYGDDLWSFFRATRYYQWHYDMRGYQHNRPDAWIEAMGRRLVRLYQGIQAEGYRCRCVADRIAVREDDRLWDGGHRLACLTALGWKDVPVVRVATRKGGQCSRA